MLRLLVVLVSFLTLASAADKAIVLLSGSANVTGKITFTETSDGVLIEGEITGLSPGNHGFHIHALGDLSNGCTSTGAHFNPENATHGAPNATVRHVGDLGNVEANSQGIANIEFTDKIISISGKNSILGRGVVVHEGEDDLGLGGHETSLSTGNAGGRLACGVIGILEEDESGSSTAAKLTTSTLALTLLLTVSTVLLKN